MPPGAKGNVATGAVCQLLSDLGYETGIDLTRLAEAARLGVVLRDNTAN
jgi:hydroxymethylglutaryl-CoA lyase